MSDSNKTHYISVVSDFSDEPYGRFRADGSDSAERFRDDLLIPALHQHDRVIVDLKGAFYGSSFLEEAFGGLVRLGFKYDDLKEKLIIEHDLQSYIHASWRYIENAAQESINRG